MRFLESLAEPGFSNAGRHCGMPLRGSHDEEIHALIVEHVDEMLNSSAPWQERERGWLCITLVVDSGAADSVAPSSMAPSVRFRESPGSRQGQNYLSAS